MPSENDFGLGFGFLDPDPLFDHSYLEYRGTDEAGYAMAGWTYYFNTSFPELSMNILKDVYLNPVLLIDYDIIEDGFREYKKYNRIGSMATDYNTGLAKVYYHILAKANALDAQEPSGFNAIPQESIT